MEISKTTQIRRNIVWIGKTTDADSNITAYMTAKYGTAYSDGEYTLEKLTEDADVDEEYVQFQELFKAAIEGVETVTIESEVETYD